MTNPYVGQFVAQLMADNAERDSERRLVEAERAARRRMATPQYLLPLLEVRGIKPVKEDMR